MLTDQQRSVILDGLQVALKSQNGRLAATALSAQHRTEWLERAEAALKLATSEPNLNVTPEEREKLGLALRAAAQADIERRKAVPVGVYNLWAYATPSEMTKIEARAQERLMTVPNLVRDVVINYAAGLYQIEPHKDEGRHHSDADQ